MTRLSGGTVVAMLIGAMALAACTERPQEGAKSAKREFTASPSGTGADQPPMVRQA